MGDQLAVIAMVRNEADILAGFLAHARALFDHALVIDHRSTDGSREILEAARTNWPELEIFDYGFQGYFQGALSTAFARRAFEDGAEWVFFLDADEFVDVPDRAALLGTLAADGTVVRSFHWRNLAPTVFGNYQGFDLRQEFLVSQAASRHSKVVLSRRILEEAPGFQVALGNHAVLPSPGAPALEALPVGEFLHTPIRSRDRLAMKVEAGVAAYRAKRGTQTDEGFHWFELLERVRAGTADDHFLRTVALNYGEPLAGMAAVPLCSARRRSIEPAGAAEALVLLGGRRGLSRSRLETESLDRKIAWRQLQAEGEDKVAVLIGEENQVTLRPRVMRPSGEPAPDVFGSLPPENDPLADDLSEHRLALAIDMIFSPVETIVPSAWSRLVPVMFGLASLLRPRRFVELGSAHGCSFFAACQAMQTLDMKAEAIAIDTWQGDPQAGYYTEAVFEEFTYLLRTRYPERSHYIRSKFEDAVGCFEDGAIDLLHIDGLHRYDAVRMDFETWLPKMSDRGIVILHDTTVYESGYGVWQLWRDIAARYPSVNLLHSHGLGIAYVGTREGRFVETLRAFAVDPTRYLLLNAILRNVGDLSIGAATSAKEAKAAKEAEAALMAARAELEVTRAMVAEIRASTSWRVSAPVRVLGRILGRKGPSV